MSVPCKSTGSSKENKSKKEKVKKGGNPENHRKPKEKAEAPDDNSAHLRHPGILPEKGLRQRRAGIGPNHKSMKVKTRTWGFLSSWKRICSHWITDFVTCFRNTEKALLFPLI